LVSTLRGAAGIVVLSCGMIFDEKISDRCSSALSVLVSMGANGPAGLGCLSASVSWMAASMAVSLEDSVDIVSCCGKNSTVSPMRSAFVLVMYMFQHR
jgi:hypothetical protein